MFNLQRRYYSDAKHFLDKIQSAQSVLKQLLVSNYKTDVIETVIFYTTATEFAIETAQVNCSLIISINLCVVFF